MALSSVAVGGNECVLAEATDSGLESLASTLSGNCERNCGISITTEKLATISDLELLSNSHLDGVLELNVESTIHSVTSTSF